MSEDLIEKLLEARRSMAPSIDPNKSALLIIDMQYYQVRKEWALYKVSNSVVPGILDYYMSQLGQTVEPNIKRLVELFRANKLKIIYTMFSSFNEDGSDLTRQWKAYNEQSRRFVGDVIVPPKDHPGSQIIDSIKPQTDDLVIIKNTSSVFTSTNLELFLKNMGIEQLFIVGVITNMCVESSTRIGSELGFDVFLIEDSCAAWSSETHRNSLRSIQMQYGSILTTDEAIKKIMEKL